MLIFHEGLPGSGKSYAAVKDWLVPMLAKGRMCYARVNGLDHERLSELAGITPEKCRELLVEILEEDIPRIYEIVTNDSFVLIDELQNFFPTQRKPLEPKMVQFVTEHRHKGLDILAMGQVLNDCHATWRNRVAQKVVFQKMDSLGKPTSYHWLVQKPMKVGDRVKWETVTKGTAKYDDTYFGSYASHRPETGNKETLTDDRANIWKMPLFRKWLPIFGVCLLAAGWKFYNVMWGGDLVKAKPGQQVTAAPPSSAQKPPGAAVDLPPQQSVPVPSALGVAPMPAPATNPVDELMTKGRLRFIGYYRVGNRSEALIEWRQEDERLLGRMTTSQLAALGWSVFVDQMATIAVLQAADRRYVATSWPLREVQGRATEYMQRTVQPPSGGYSKVPDPIVSQPWPNPNTPDGTNIRPEYVPPT